MEELNAASAQLAIAKRFEDEAAWLKTQLADKNASAGDQIQQLTAEIDKLRAQCDVAEQSVAAKEISIAAIAESSRAMEQQLEKVQTELDKKGSQLATKDSEHKQSELYLSTHLAEAETQLDELRHKNRELQAVLDSEVSVRAINI